MDELALDLITAIQRSQGVVRLKVEIDLENDTALVERYEGKRQMDEDNYRDDT